MRKPMFVFALFFALHISSYSQQNDTALISQLIDNIAQQQVQQNTKDFYAGQFPSYRECGGSPHNYQPDNNIFYTAVSVFALKNMLPYVSQKAQQKITNIIRKATESYQLYRNKNNLPFYNFWAQNDVIMPHTFVFQYLKTVFGQSEDADDSVMALLGLNNNDSDNIALKKRLVETSNLSRKKIISTLKKYRNIAAYSTWTGQRMPVDFDFGVHCNVMYFMLEKKMPFAKQDSATIDLLKQMIAARDYLKSPVFISPYYVKTSVLLYHIARLMGKFSIKELEPYKPQLIHDIQQQLTMCNNVMEQLMLRTSLLRLNGSAPEVPQFTIADFERSNQKQFVFFQARAAFSYPVFLKQIFLYWSYVYYFFYCPAYYKILWLEYLVEKEKHRSTK